MERRKDTPYRFERLPSEYLGMIRSVFEKNFSDRLKGRGKNRESFVVYGEIYPDEVLLAVSLKNPSNLRMMTCYASIDYPPAAVKGESGSDAIVGQSASQAVQMSVNFCVDVVAGFFETFFSEDRPVDYDVEYQQDWVIIEVDKTTRVYLRINRDNLEIEAASDDFLAQHEAMHEAAVMGAEQPQKKSPSGKKKKKKKDLDEGDVEAELAAEAAAEEESGDESSTEGTEEPQDPNLELPAEKKRKRNPGGSSTVH
jgi:hypothetical protein